MSADSAADMVASTDHHAGHEPGTTERRLATADLWHDARGELPGRPAHHRSDGGADPDLVSADQGSQVVRIRGAAQEAEERDVIDVGKVLALQAEAIADGNGDQAGPERLLERLPHAEVGGQGEGGDELRQPQRLRHSLDQS